MTPQLVNARATRIPLHADAYCTTRTSLPLAGRACARRLRLYHVMKCAERACLSLPLLSRRKDDHLYHCTHAPRDHAYPRVIQRMSEKSY